MRFKIKNSNIFPMPGQEGNPNKILHLGTISTGLREFIVMACISGPAEGKCFIEEATLTSQDFSNDVTCHSMFIKDDNLVTDLAAFCTEQGLLSQDRIMEQMMAKGLTSWISGPLGSKQLSAN